MALIPEANRLTAMPDPRLRANSSSSSRSGASSRDSSESRSGAKYTQPRKQSSPAFLSTDYVPSTAWSTPSPVRSSHQRTQSAKNPSGHRRSSAVARRGTIAVPYAVVLAVEAFRSCGGSNSYVFNDEEAEDVNLYRLRNFAVTPKGKVKNKGDSYRARSHTSLSPTDIPRSQRVSVSSSFSTTETSVSGDTTSVPNPRYRVLISGGCGVGKTALTTQFLSSEYMNAYDTFSTDDEDGQEAVEKSVSILLDGQESELDFIDLDPTSAVYEENLWENSPVDAHVIVYNVVDRPSFEKAIDILFELKQSETTKHQAIILVGNKSDLVRARTISVDEGKSIASSYDCKFIETSAGLNHNVDELLVGILTQIRLKEKQAIKNSRNRRALKFKCRNSKNRSLTDKAVGFLTKLLSGNSLSKSCGNLHVI